jgi:hypothetical protein
VNPHSSGVFGIKKIALFLKTQVILNDANSVSEKEITVASSSWKDPNRSIRLPFKTVGKDLKPNPLAAVPEFENHTVQGKRWLEYDLTHLLLREFHERNRNSASMIKVASHFKILSSFMTFEFEEKHVSS